VIMVGRVWGHRRRSGPLGLTGLHLGAESRSLEPARRVAVAENHGGTVIASVRAARAARENRSTRIEGAYRGGTETFLRVQRWEGGEWLDFPLPTKTDQSGRFTAFVEFGQPGRYRLRVLDPGSGLTSKSFVVVIN
jgi:hypothetical protein